ncbi:MAG TPA: helix-turn-helix domain-containing protein [Chloroflexota bacterium]|nr:helix-turn-helix domain-containing protein [Chloroflexota bacterium]
MTKTQQPLPDRMKAAEVAAYLGMSVDAVYDLRASGKLPAIPHGNRSWRWKRATVLAFDTAPLPASALPTPDALTALIDARVAAAFEAVAAQLRNTTAAQTQRPS